MAHIVDGNSIANDIVDSLKERLSGIEQKPTMGIVVVGVVVVGGLYVS